MGPNPIKREHLVKSREDLDRLQYLLPKVSHNFAGYFSYEKALGENGLVEMTIAGPLEHQAGSARGQENLMMDYYDDRPFFDAILGVFHKRGMAQMKAALEAGVKIIFGNWYWTSLSAGWSPKQFQEVFLPMIRDHAELVHAYNGIYHYYDDGKCMKILPWLKEAGVDVFSTCTPPPVGDFDLATAKRTVGDRICLKGYVDLLYVVKMGTPQLVDRTVREAMEIAKPGGGFILGSSDSFREGTPVENIRAYFEAGRKYGRY
jgi:uroporphyrinogen decarboxylase